MIINEVLCTLIYRLNANAVENLNNVLVNFYSDEEIVNAKKALWQIAPNDKIGEYIDRNNTRNRPAKSEHVKDMIKAMKQLDAVNMIPDVAAKDLDRIPSMLPEELNMLMLIQRVANLEKCRDEHNDILTKMLIDVLGLQDGVRPDTAKKDNQLGLRTAYSDVVSGKANKVTLVIFQK